MSWLNCENKILVYWELRIENQKGELKRQWKPYLLVLKKCCTFSLGVIEIGLSSCPHVLPF